jgi:chemotaxis protein MotB
MTATATLSQGAMPADNSTEDQFPWDLETAPSVVESDTWLLSFVDVLTLLLALFVLLLAQEHQQNKTRGTAIPHEPVRIVYEDKPKPAPAVSVAPVPALQPFATIQLPALPQIVTPLSHLRIPSTDRTKKPVKEAVEIDKPAPEIDTETEVSVTDKQQNQDIESETIEHKQPGDTALTASPVDQLMETLRASKLADRIDIQARSNSLRLDIADSILFAPARTTLTESGITLLGELAATLNTLPWSLSVEGHTDNIPIETTRFPSNWELSTARASSVARELIRNGVEPERIRAVGYADTRPRDSNDTPEGRNRNRRVTFVLELPEQPRQKESEPIKPQTVYQGTSG